MSEREWWLTLKFSHEVIDQTVVKILTTQMSVAGSRLDLEDTLLNGEERYIESSTTKVEDENIAFTFGFLV